MSDTQTLLIEFLSDYSVDAFDNGVSLYKRNRAGIHLRNRTEDDEFNFTVKSESNSRKQYDVLIDLNTEIGELDAGCTCAAMARYDTCKHIAASAIFILTNVYSVPFADVLKLLGEYTDIEYADVIDDTLDKNAAAKIIPLFPVPDIWQTITASPQTIFYTVNGYRDYYSQAELKKITHLSTIDEPGQHVLLKLSYQQNKSTVYEVFINYNRRDIFFFKCSCGIGRICGHIKTAFSFLNSNHHNGYFNSFKNYDFEKNELLKPYGLTIADKEAAEINFAVDARGYVSMTQPTWLWKMDMAKNATAFRDALAIDKKRPEHIATDAGTLIDFEIGFLFSLASQHFRTGFELETIKVTDKKGKPQLKKLSIHLAANLPLLKELPDDVYEQLLNITEERIKKHLALSGVHIPYYGSPWSQLGPQDIKTLKRYYAGVVKKLWPYLCNVQRVYMLKEGSFNSSNILPAKLSAAEINFSFEVTEDDRYITIRMKKTIDGEPVNDEAIKQVSDYLFVINDELHMLADTSMLDLVWEFERGYIKIPVAAKAQALKAVIIPLQQKYTVVMPASFNIQIVEAAPVPQILLREMDGKFLILQPQYVYNGLEVNYESAPEEILINTDNTIQIIKRDAKTEKAFFDSLRGLHPKFERPALNNFFFLPFEDTMKQNWFIDTIVKLVANNIPVMGMQALKQHKYNTNKPKWEMKAGSGIDWFDLQIKISFGDQEISLRDIRRALLNNQSIVMLGDGTFGVLPEDWLKQYGLLLKMGEEQKSGTLRVSKLHYTLIDELHGQIDDEEILKELHEKKQRLLNVGEIKTVKPGKEIKATLRPYQLSGFHWFQTLDEMGWGGCLADDMGLGKTLQTITFLQYLKKKYKGSTHLVICPTSLIYNWESELQKFAPSLKFYIYYGHERELSEAHFNDYDVIITSYGIIRNDIKELLEFDWYYLILDESQAIKNPDAVTNKALQLLKSKNRMILSGTPIQNNTYDLFAQFHFINPGLLGNREFFKTEFANPIDKNNDAERTAQLRRLIYPFMLRRTKEQVATDLPDKTETILWCEMPKEQKAVYDEYKTYYRNTLLEKIAEVGMAKAGMYVLEGLLRLRQICDSPELVKDKGIKTQKSVKIDELVREIEENTGAHKMLIFSQFTEMLHLIEAQLRLKKVMYVYLDGSTPAEKRKESVNNFQEDPEIRVFLISLKAGGVGLNLTAADYVYIVDPWWNPAVEQQAIDRTHRIGQSNKIFAYKMICKDTVEEKILQLQQRKKQLANDLVTEDAGFIKKLTKDDIAFLFS